MALQEGMARKVDDFVYLFDVRRKDFLNMEKRTTVHLVDKSYYPSLCKPVESRDEMGRIIDALWLDPPLSRSMKKWCRGVNDIVRHKGDLDGRAPASVVAAIIKLVAAAVGITMPQDTLRKASFVLPSTMASIASIMESNDAVQSYLSTICVPKKCVKS